jgi:signal transduction histidine kinase
METQLERETRSEREGLGAPGREQLTAAVGEALPVGLALFRGRDLRLRWCNTTYRSYFERSDGTLPDLAGLRLDDYAPRAISEGVLSRLREVAGGGGPTSTTPLEFRGQTLGLSWWRYVLVPYEVEGERHVLATILEITDEVGSRRRAEALAASLEGRLGELKLLHREAARRAAELDATLAAVAEGLVLYDAEGRIARMNDAARDLSGYTDEDRRRPIDERAERIRMFDADGAPIPPEEFLPKRALAGEVFRGVVLGLDRPEGRAWVSVSAAPIVDEAGRRQGAVLTLTDITRQRRMQEEMADLLRMVSHDLRTPLTAIQLRAQRLARALAEGGKERETAEAMAAGCRRMDAMIKELVEWGRLGVGLVELEPKPVELAPLLSGLVARNAPAVDAARLELAIPEGFPPIRADPDRLERVFLNLITNALKYSPPETRVRVEAERADGEARIRVIDRGAGIAPEDRDRIFDRFYRSRTGQQAEGLGLGLFITKRLVEAHHGRLLVRSELGRGSTFEVRLPT